MISFCSWAEQFSSNRLWAGVVEAIRKLPRQEIGPLTPQVSRTGNAELVWRSDGVESETWGGFREMQSSGRIEFKETGDRLQCLKKRT